MNRLAPFPFVPLAVLILAFAALAQSPKPAADPQTTAQKYFTDTVLVDQNGKSQRLFTDLMKDKVVIVEVFHTDCANVGPPIHANFRKIQSGLADRAAEYRILSITIDPLNDTPPVLKKFATTNKAETNWFFLTGDKPNVDLVLKKFGLYADKKEDHLTIIIIGNVRTGLWKKAFGLAKPDELISVVRSVLDDKGTDK